VKIRRISPSTGPHDTESVKVHSPGQRPGYGEVAKENPEATNQSTSMYGCRSITLDYAESFPQDEEYEIHDSYHAIATAKRILVEEEDEIIIRHLLVISDSMIVKQ
jgi:hypothetical protein